MLMFELLTGYIPFNGDNRKSLKRCLLPFLPHVNALYICCCYRQIVKCAPIIPTFLTSESRNLIKFLLVKDPDQRLGSKQGAAEIKSHAWFKVRMYIT